MKQDIKDKIIKYLLIGLAVLIFILSITTIRGCKKISMQKRTIETINAMNDSIILVKTKTDTFYQKSVITMHPKQIIKEGIKSNNPETNKFIKDLEKEKKLVSALQIELETKDSKYTDLIELINLQDSLNGEISENNLDGIYKFSDSITNENKNFKYFGEVLINQNNPKLNFNYVYKVKIKSIVTEDKKGYIAKYYLDDPNSSIIGADQIYISKPNLSKGQKAKNILLPTFTGLVGFGLGYGTGQLINK
jgi:hypothetical protein